MAALRRRIGANSASTSGDSSRFADGAGEFEGKNDVKEPQPTQAPNVIDRLRSSSQSHVGKGDYTAERAQLFKGESVESIIAEIKAKRTENEAK